MKFKGEPLEITYGHYDNGDTHITYGKCELKFANFPEPIKSVAYSYLMLDEYLTTIKEKTYCKHSDDFDSSIGERVVRKKIMKRYMSIVRQLCDNAIKEINKDIDDFVNLRTEADKCNKSIIEYLKTV